MVEQVSKVNDFPFCYFLQSESDEHKDFVSHHILRLAYAKSWVTTAVVV